MDYILEENENVKILKSQFYNYYFDKHTGFFLRYGIDKTDDPEFSIFGPEIADIEITEKCYGIRCDLKDEKSRKICKFCYKSNNPNKETYMSFEDFQIIFHKIPKILTQIAFGVDSQCKTNPDVWKILEYCRNNDYNYVIPNITVADIDDETAKELAKICGAIAVSYYPDQNKECCFESIKLLNKYKVNQCNIHCMLSKETFNDILWLFNYVKKNKTFKKMINAIVLLSLKQKGRGVSFHQVDQKQFKELVEFALKNNIPIGFDSCSTFKFLNSVKDHKNFKNFKILSEPCESSLFSTYINCKGYFFPCSFVEGEQGWKRGLNVKTCKNFLKDIWFHDRTKKFRKVLLQSKNKNKLQCRECPIFKI